MDDKRMILAGKLASLLLNEKSIAVVIIAKIPIWDFRKFQIYLDIRFIGLDGVYVGKDHRINFLVPSEMFVEGSNIDIDEQADYFFKSIMKKINEKILA